MPRYHKRKPSTQELTPDRIEQLKKRFKKHKAMRDVLREAREPERSEPKTEKSIKAKHMKRLEFRMLVSRRISLGVLKETVFGYEKTDLDSEQPFAAYGCQLTQYQLFGSDKFRAAALKRLSNAKNNNIKYIDAIIDEACDNQGQHFKEQMEEVGTPEYYNVYKIKKP